MPRYSAKVTLSGLLLAGVALLQTGCAVPQPRGDGKQQRVVEKSTNTGYWLYLPEDYTKNDGQRPDGRRWPIVLTLHGLRPYDNAVWQNKEWQQEADRYGFIVVAPELRTCDSLIMQYPLRDKDLWYVREDEKAVLAILDDVSSRVNADPSRVLITSFSSGGYLAHFLLNEHPERFTCLAVRGSNFNAQLLDATKVTKYRNTNIGIFFGENDFKDCRDQSMEALAWYKRYRFPVEGKRVSGLGHERRPELAAAFFARTIGVEPKTPPDLGSLVMQEVVPIGSVRTVSRTEDSPRAPNAMPSRPPASTTHRTMSTPSRPPATRDLQAQSSIFNATSPRPVPQAPQNPVRVAPHRPTTRTPPAVRTAPRRVTPRRRYEQPYATPVRPAPRIERPTRRRTVPTRERVTAPPPAAGIRVHGKKLGVSPMWVSLSVNLPEKVRKGASILWTDNKRPISAGTFQASTVLREPGNHLIEARIITADDRKMILTETIRVLPPTSSQPAPY